MNRLFAILSLFILTGCSTGDETPYLDVTHVVVDPLDVIDFRVEHSSEVDKIVSTTKGVLLPKGYSSAYFGHYLPGNYVVNVKLYDGGKLKNEHNVKMTVRDKPTGDFMGVFFRNNDDYLAKLENDTMILQLERYWDYEPHTHYAGITCEVKEKFKAKFNATTFLRNYITMFYGNSEYVDESQNGALYETYDKIFERKLIELNEMPIEIWKAPKCDIALIKTTRNTSYIIAQKKPLM